MVDESMVQKHDPSTRYNRLLDSAGIEGEIQMRLDAVRSRIADRASYAVLNYCRGHALDIGAGTLVFAQNFQSHFISYITVDYEVRSAALDLQADGHCLPFGNNSFDTVISIDVLEHLKHPWQMMEEIERVLVPGGIAVLITPFFFWAHEEPYDFFRISRYGLKNLCIENGLEVLEITATCGFVASIGLLGTIAITRVFHKVPHLLRLILWISRQIQLTGLLWLDDRIDRSKRFAQGHLLVARKPITEEERE